MALETLTSGTAAPAEAAAPVIAAAAAPVGQAAAAPADGTQATSEAGQAAPQGEGQGAGNETAADGGQPQGDGAAGAEGGEAQGAPEAYADFSMPDGFTLEGEMLTSLATTAKGLNLTQEQAQGLVDLGVAQAQRITEAFSQSPVPLAQTWHNTWMAQTKADPEIGGDKLAAVLPVAKQALDTFSTPALTELLTTTGLGSHPEIVRFLNKVGGAISEEKLVLRDGATQGGRKDAAKTLYPNMN